MFVREDMYLNHAFSKYILFSSWFVRIKRFSK
nr:MAG TPA: hypothetical protein [Caudoviricetes sp.]